jgi:SEC-C motif
MSANDLDEIREYLTDVVLRTSGEQLREAADVAKGLKTIKDVAVSKDDQATAKLVWRYEQILQIQQNYLQAFSDIRAGKYYVAWCLFERVEIELHRLERHFPTSDDNFKLRLIDKHTRQFQSLYPYKYFISPAYLILEASCLICGRKRSIRSSCGHILGEIYNGEVCGRLITKAKLLEISLVEKPVQKYSVPFTNDPKTGEQIDHYDYFLVQYVAKGLREPFDEWDSNWTQRRQPHARYKHVGRNGQCPCESNKKYKKCCLNESGVLRPHMEITFHTPPPEDLPPIMYTD